MIAFSTIADGIATSGKQLLVTGGAAASTVVGHKYGDQAGSIAADLAGGVKNVGLVYIDVAGVSRRAVIKSVAKGMVVGKVRGGGEVVVGGGDGGSMSEDEKRAYDGVKGTPGKTPKEDMVGGSGYFGPTSGRYEPVGSPGEAPPPKYREYGEKR